MSTIPVLRHLRSLSSRFSDRGKKNINDLTSGPFEHYSWALSDTLACFPGVTKYTVHWNNDLNNNHRSIPVMGYIWECLGSNLCTLEWESQLENLHLLLLECASIHFPYLQNLSLKLRRPADQAHLDTERFHTSVTPFINRHASTIQSLSLLGIEYFSPQIDKTSLLSVVGHFPRLQRFTFETGIVSGRHLFISNPLVLADFLGRHAGTLQHLSLRISGHRNRRGQWHEVGDALLKVFSAGLDNLGVLEMRHYDCFPSTKAIFESIHCFADTITTLIIDSNTQFGGFTYEEVKNLLMAFSHRSADRGLTTLFLVVDVLSPQLVDLLASALPGLRSLTLRIRTIQSRPTSILHYSTSLDSPEHFQTEMEKRVYHSWALRYINVQQLGRDPGWAASIISQRICTKCSGLPNIIPAHA